MQTKREMLEEAERLDAEEDAANEAGEEWLAEVKAVKARAARFMAAHTPDDEVE